MSFKSIKGQDKAIHLLREYIEQDRLYGGYLFAGQEGVGKKLVATTLAKTVNCVENNSEACDKCPSCAKIDKGQHPDVFILTAEESEIKIEAVRQLQKQISLAL